MRMRVVVSYTNGQPVQYLVERTGDCREHNHDLEEMDQRKRPAGIMKIAAER